MKVILLTLSPQACFLERFYLWFKKYIKNHVFYYGGPQAVLGSLIRGFDKLKVDYQLNPRTQDISDIVCVVSGVNALKWAIKAKKKGKIKKIIAGPNLVITPNDAEGILLNETIDLVIVPSQWVKDFYASFKLGFGERIRVWAAGVEIPPQSKEKREECLIYKKSVDKNLFNFILKYLKSQNVNYKIIEYGRYKRERYFEILSKVKFMIYLQEVESEGIALLEAWIRNVPTFVWNRGYFEYKKVAKKVFGNISAPYLAKECGMFFKDFNDFKEKLPFFLADINQFKSREYAIKNFSDEVTAKNYLEIIKELQ